MAFTTRRGRPRTLPPETDLGTPELRLKHALKITAEPIDICLEKQLITSAQHWCGLHLRWLYTVRYGAPALSTYYGDRDTRPIPYAEDDPEWRQRREEEFAIAAQLLRRARRYDYVARIIIYNERPVFLSSAILNKAKRSPALSEQLQRRLLELRDGLDILRLHWRPRSATH